jgi:hypothetical protein
LRLYRQRDSDLLDVAATQVTYGAACVACEKVRFEARALAERNRENATIRLVLRVNENVLTKTPLDFFSGQSVGDYTAEFGVDLFGDAFERIIGEEGDDERSGAHVTGRIVTKTNLHGGPFRW